MDLEFLHDLLILGGIDIPQELHVFFREHELPAGAGGQRPGHRHLKCADRFGILRRVERDADRLGVKLRRLRDPILRELGLHREGGLFGVLGLDRWRVERHLEFFVFGKKIRADFGGLSGRVDHRDFDRVCHRPVRLVRAHRPRDRHFKKWFYGDRRRHQPQVPQLDDGSRIDRERPELERQRQTVGVRPREPVRSGEVELALVPGSLRRRHDCQAPLMDFVLPRAAHMPERAEIHKVELTADNAEFKFQPVEIPQARKQRMRRLHLQLGIFALHQSPPDRRNALLFDFLRAAVDRRPHLLDRIGFELLDGGRRREVKDPGK